MSWTEQAWKRSAPVYERILSMPFIQELQQGTLSAARFRFYIAQDARYLEHFSKALAIIGARLPDKAASLSFYRFAENAIVVENALHESYFRDFGVTGMVVAEPACHHYVHFLLSQASLQPVEVAMASVLPCFRIYREAGRHIHARASSGNPYQRWIDTYVNEDFDSSVQEAIRLCDREASAAAAPLREAMTEAFVTACRLEYDFWDAAYHMRTWSGVHPA